MTLAKAMIKLVLGWKCRHRWRIMETIINYPSPGARKPIHFDYVCICRRCGKIRAQRV